MEKQLLNQINIQFDVMNLPEKKRGYFTNEENGENIPITGDDFWIGRDRRMCHYCIEKDSSVSKIHICISCESLGVVLLDMNTRNGTYLNDRKLQGKEPVLLQDGDKVKIGQQILIYHAE